MENKRSQTSPVIQDLEDKIKEAELKKKKSDRLESQYREQELEIERLKKATQEMEEQVAA